MRSAICDDLHELLLGQMLEASDQKIASPSEIGSHTESVCQKMGTESIPKREIKNEYAA